LAAFFAEFQRADKNVRAHTGTLYVDNDATPPVRKPR
jgi:hypothetical protein